MPGKNISRASAEAAACKPDTRKVTGASSPSHSRLLRPKQTPPKAIHTVFGRLQPAPLTAAAAAEAELSWSPRATVSTAERSAA